MRIIKDYVFGPPWQGADAHARLSEASDRLSKEAQDLSSDVSRIGGHRDPIGAIIQNIRKVHRN